MNFADPIDKIFGESVDLYTPSALSGIYRYWVADPQNPQVVNGQRITQNSSLLVAPPNGSTGAGSTQLRLALRSELRRVLQHFRE